jgi:hypothetical protein
VILHVGIITDKGTKLIPGSVVAAAVVEGIETLDIPFR